MVCRNEVTLTHPQKTGRYRTVWCVREGWVKKQTPNSNQRVMPEKGWGNAQDMQTWLANVSKLKVQVEVKKPNTDSTQKTVGWKDINWRQVERYVFKLQKRIYAASRRGEVKLVRKLQKILMNSWSCRALAVRRVTQDNRGRAT